MNVVFLPENEQTTRLTKSLHSHNKEQLLKLHITSAITMARQAKLSVKTEGCVEFSFVHVIAQ